MLDWDEYIEGTHAFLAAVSQRSKLIRRFLFPSPRRQHPHAGQGQAGGEGVSTAPPEPTRDSVAPVAPLPDVRAGRQGDWKRKITELKKLAVKPGDGADGADGADQSAHVIRVHSDEL